MNIRDVDPILTVLERIEQKLASTAGVSSVEIRTSARGVDISTKAYTGSDIRPAGNAALEEYLRLREEVERRLMGSQT